MNLTTATPVEIDTALYALYREGLKRKQKLLFAIEAVHYAANDKREYLTGYRQPTWLLDLDTALKAVAGIAGNPSAAGYQVTKAKEAISDYLAAVDAIKANVEEQRPLQAEYARRPWTRAFLVTDGHVHSSMDCSTCFITTEFSWLVDLSGADEAEIVKLAGERACTVCYPTAPTLRDFEKVSPLFTEEEAERNAAREARAAEKAERLAKKIEKALNPDGSEFVIRVGGYTEYFKTEKAAVQWAVATMADGYAHQNTHEYIDARNAIFDAVARKHNKPIEQVRQEIDIKVQAKIKRNQRGY